MDKKLSAVAISHQYLKDQWLLRYIATRSNIVQDRQCSYKVTIRSARVAIVAMVQQ